jgi:uncharacterized protein YerC
MTAEMEALFPALLELARSEDHENVLCGLDDTCTCPNIAKLNAEFNTIRRLLLAAADRVEVQNG